VIDIREDIEVCFWGEFSHSVANEKEEDIERDVDYVFPEDDVKVRLVVLTSLTSIKNLKSTLDGRRLRREVCGLGYWP
jgi:hypothetical protein